ncbi:MAG: DUF2599 domain-containing protein [Williamsia sp.]|nr:DUF2599 domain-containing protein [Williamsia sp.]
MVIVAALLAGCGESVPAPTVVSSSPSAPPEVITSSVPAALPPFIERTTWVETPLGRSLQVVPTASGRRAQGAGDEDVAWKEVVAADATADSPGMEMQFQCHWTFARVLQPDKPSWNLEPWRPVVTDQEMVDARCNPGGAEE